MHLRTKAGLYANFWPKKNIVELGHPPYSPDLAACDFWLFPKLKLAMERKRFDTIADIQKASTASLGAVPKNEFHECFKKFHNRFNACIDSQGDYFE
jgi:hypothetical protein